MEKEVKGAAYYKAHLHDNANTIEQKIRGSKHADEQCHQNLPPNFLVAETKNLVYNNKHKTFYLLLLIANTV